MAVTVAIVDDDFAYSEGIKELLEKTGLFSCVATCLTGEEGIERLPFLEPRIVLMDIKLPGMSGPSCVSQLSALLPGTEFIMLTVFEEYDLIYEALVSGATGYLLKRTAPGEIIEAIREVVNGGSPMSGSIARKVIMAFRQMAGSGKPVSPLSLREEEILKALAKGRRPKEIAQDTGLSFHTVRTHLQNIYKKLQVCSRKDAIRHLETRKSSL